MVLFRSIASLVATGFFITLIFSPACARPPAPGSCSLAGWESRPSTGCWSGRATRRAQLLGLRGGAVSADAHAVNAQARWYEQIARGDSHSHAGEWASAIPIYTRALSESSSMPTLAVIQLYSNRATCLYRQGLFVKAGEDVRAGLALFPDTEPSLAEGAEGPSAPALPDELVQLKKHLSWMDTDLQQAVAAQHAAVTTSAADLDLAVEQAAASTRDVSAAAPTTIPAGSPLCIALGDVGTADSTTKYFFETQHCALSPGAKQRFVATLWVSTCIAVFVSSPDGRAFAAHISGDQLLQSLHARSDRGGGGMILEDVSRAMQDAFRGVDPSEITIRLVGGHKKSDLDLQDLAQKGGGLKSRFFPHEPSMWSFSGVMRRCVAEAMPGAAIDTSLLNRFDGVEGGGVNTTPQAPGETPKDGAGHGQLFQVIALDKHTGQVVSQTQGASIVPKSVLGDACWHLKELHGEKLARAAREGGQ